MNHYDFFYRYDNSWLTTIVESGSWGRRADDENQHRREPTGHSRYYTRVSFVNYGISKLNSQHKYNASHSI